MFEFKLPDIGEGVHEGEVVRWLVKEGESVKEDQPIVEVMTDKATVEITSPRAGRIAKLAVKEGQVLKVGELLVAIEEGAGAGPAKPAAPAATAQPAAPSYGKTAGEAVEEKKDKTLFEGLAEGAYGKYQSPEARARAAQAAQAQGAPAELGPGGKVLATPAVRKHARELGVDITRVKGSGPHGRVTHEDLEAFAGQAARPAGAAQAMQPLPPAAAKPKAAPPPLAAAGPEVERVPIRALRKRIYENMRRSKDLAAHFTYVEECDVEELVQLRDDAKGVAEQQGVKLTYLPFIVKATVAALKQYPDINAHIDDNAMELVRSRRYHIGVAVQTERGLMVFVVHDADRKGVLQIAREMQELSDQARAGTIKPDALKGSTFTITSLGKTGGLLATPIINYPEVAIMGVHKIEQRAVVEGGQVVPRWRMNLSFSFDHRVIDGAVGAEFAHAIIRYLEDPKLLLLETV